MRYLIDFDENIEYIVKYSIKLSVDGKDWQERYSALIVIKILCENKRDFFLIKKNYCKKIIECLVYGYKNCSEVIKKESANILTKFLSQIPNYAEITKILSPEIVNRIFQMQCQSTTEIESKLDKLIEKSIKILSNPLLNANKKNYDDDILNIDNYNEENNNNNYNENNIYIDHAGFAFGIFPSDLINKLNNINLSLEEKIECFQELYDIFSEKSKESSFLRFASTFFKFISKFISSNSVTICKICLGIMNDMISSIVGVNLIASFYQTIPIIIFSFDNNNVSVRDLIFKVLSKIIMIIPTSQMIPYLINAISKNHDKWILLQESLNFLDYIFLHLNEIYNDIEWSGQNKNYDLNIFLEILKLWDHPVKKVVSCAKKVILNFGERISKNKENFIKTLTYYTNDALSFEIKALFEHKKIIRFSPTKFDVATQRVLSALNPQFNIKNADEENNLIIFNKINKYNRLGNDNDNRIVDENLMKDLLDNNRNIIKQTHRPPKDNYQNYGIGEKQIEKEFTKTDYEYMFLHSN